MKKIVALLICVLLIAALAIPALAADDTVVTITPSATTVAPGEEVTFTVTVSGGNEYNALGLMLKYDKTQFEMVEGKCTVSHAATSQFSAKRGFVLAFEEPEAFEGTVGWFTLKAIAECPVEATVNATPSVKNGSASITASVVAAGVSITGEHTYGNWEQYTLYEHIHTCSKCGAEETAEHNWGEPTVLQESNCYLYGTAKKACTDCSHEVEYELELNPNKHYGYESQVTPPTCTEQGYTTYTCICGDTYEDNYVPANGHDYKTVVTAPTCTEQGYTTYTCSVCGDSYVDNYVPANGHSFGAWQDSTPGKHLRECACGAQEIEDHNWTDETVIEASTCVKNGNAKQECADCSAVKSYALELDPDNHAGYTSVVTAPTCTEQGYTTYTCVCGDSYVDSYTNPTGHKMGDWDVVTPATCETDGQKRKDCENCDYSETGTITKLGHNYTSEVTKEATCKEEGVKTFTCQNDSTHTYTESIPKTTTHTASGESVVIKAPTCTETGISSGTCAVCGVNMDEFETPALGHDMGEWYVKTDSTCTAEGEKRSDCSRCDHYDSEVIEKKDHTYESVVTEPTCTKNGYTTHTCSVCGNSYETPGDKALGHEYTSEVTTEPGCETKGVRTYTCVRGDHSYTEDIAATGHSKADMEITKEPTCEEDGVMSGKCSVCRKELSNEKIPAIGHDYELTGEVAPTCTEKGGKTYTCKNDAAHTYTEEIAALGHTYGDWISVDGENHKHVCACGHEETVAHKWDTGKVTVEPTHTETGIKTYECKDCHAIREEEVAKTTKHEYTDKAEQIVDEDGKVDTKYHTGICACGEQHKEKHSYDIEGDVIKEPTSTERGEKEMFCACGHKIVVKIKADGTLDSEPGMGDITGQVVMTGIAAFSMIAAAAYVCIRKRFA